MHSSNLCRVFVVLALSSTTLSFGTDVPNDDRPTTYDDPTGKSNGTAFASRVSAEAGDADAKATGRLAGVFGCGSPNYGRYGVSVSAPFDPKKAEKVDVGTVSGLTAGSSVSAELGWMQWQRPEPKDVHDMDAACEQEISRAIEGYTLDMVSFAGGPTANCEPGLFDRSALEVVIKAIKEKRESCAKNAPTNPEEKKLCKTLTDLPPPQLNSDALEESKTRLRAVQVFKPIRTVSIGASANTQEFVYVVATAPQNKIKENKTGHGFSLAYTEIDVSMLWSVGVSTETTRKGGDKMQVCNPIDSTGATSCFEAAIGAPATKDANLAFGEIRTLFQDGHLGLTPRAEYDFKNSEWAMRLPVYFVSNVKGQLVAGVALGYTSEKHTVAASLFIGKAFSFIK